MMEGSDFQIMYVLTMPFLTLSIRSLPPPIRNCLSPVSHPKQLLPTNTRDSAIQMYARSLPYEDMH
jgi:hypothetical protein